VVTAPVLWAVTSGTGGKGGSAAHGNDGRTPAATITPGPAATGPLNSSRPGGSVGGGSGGGTVTTGGGSAGGTGTSTLGTSGYGGTSGGRLPADSKLPDCTSPAVTLNLSSVKNSYDPGEKPQFKLTAVNAGGVTCKLDFGATAAVLTISDVNNNRVWASDDCPADRSATLLQVPANSSTTYVVTWNAQTSSPNCATPKDQAVPTGATYLIGAKLPRFAAKQTSFFLKSV
jgi:hypothetical protein